MEVPEQQEQIDSLNQQAWETRVNDSINALQLSGQAMQISRDIHYPKGLAEALRTYGFCLIRQSRHEEAQTCLKESLGLFLDLGDKKGQSVIYEYYGIIARNKGDFKLSLEHLYNSFQLRKAINDREGEALSMYHLGVTYRYLGNLEKALDLLLQCLDVSRKSENWIAESYAINNIGSIYLEMGNLEDALDYIQQSLVMRKSQGDQWGTAGCLDNLGRIYFLMQDYLAATDYFEKALAISTSISDKKGEGNALLHLAELNLVLGDFEQAKLNANKCLQIRQNIGDLKGQGELLLLLIDLSDDHQILACLERAMELALATGSLDLQFRIHGRYYQYYKKQQLFDKALHHVELYHQVEKEFHSQSLGQKIVNLQIAHQVEQSQKESEIYRLKNIELANTLMELKSAQAQLIHSEKMASLGELTAGIAHEIQNPLNFVNNFSDVNTELIDEATNAINAGRHEDAKELLSNLRENEEKIKCHGERADAIVKSMLQHSRRSTGIKESTDINMLADEYLRLAYHGLRAKDKSFNVTLKKDFDQNICEISVIPQDIGRVLLNLFNNALYAVAEMKKMNINGYDPTITVSTKRLEDKVTIRVEDNGTGIPEKVRDKIFQPFFTTKPTGHGTGLGLSLSYEILKAHGGELKAESVEGAGSIFTIEIPVI